MSEATEPQASNICCRVVITGAAGNTGMMCAQAFARAGAKLALVDIDRVMASRIANDVGAEPFCFDVLSEISVRRFSTQLTQGFGTADLLINAAGRGFVRTLGMMRVTRAMAQAAEDSPFLVVNVGAREGRRGDRLDYAGSSIAFRRLSEGLADALGKPNLKIVTLGALEVQEQVDDLVRQICKGQAKQAEAVVKCCSGEAA